MNLHHLYVCEIRNCVQKMTDISNDNPNADKLRDDYEKMINGTKICEKLRITVKRMVLCVKQVINFITLILLKKWTKILIFLDLKMVL